MDKQDPNLQFKPLSEGLGFHPYSNGLPYSPTSQPNGQPKAEPKRDVSRGVGAVAAGRPSFAFPQPTVKTANVATTVAASIVAKTPQLEIELGWGYLAKRFFAFFVDSFINILLGSTALVVSLWKEGGTLDFFQPGIFLITVSFLLFFNWALTTAQEVAFGTSIGKKFFGLSLEGTAIATLVRAIFFIPGALFLGVGVLWAVLDSNRRGFHDIVSGIQPEES